MATPSLDLRCYCHGLGDCMLLSLPRDGVPPFRILIDCGIHSASRGGPDRIRDVVNDIKRQTEDAGHVIDVVVGTHEHWDHLSAFLQAADIFAGLKVGEVWFSWAEDPDNPQARRLDRFKADAAAALADASLRLSSTTEFPDLSLGVDSLLGFVFGADGEKVREARERLRKLSDTVRYLKPGEMAPLPVKGVRCYVLGPPEDERLLGIEDIVSETYAFGGGLPTVMPLANALSLQSGDLDIDDDPGAPFDGAVGGALKALTDGDWSVAGDTETQSFLWEHYFRNDAACDQDWRRIDDDWLASSAELALQLDSRTNNSSLVLAFEIVETGRVLLFAADAQVGNWKSWDAVKFAPEPGGPAVTGDDLIRRTVFYKVGHHGSRNATVAAALEKMDRSRLVAFNPTDQSMAQKVRWKDFPAAKTSQRILELTAGRFFPADAPWIKDPSLPAPVQKGGALLDFQRAADGLFVDLKIG